MSKKKVITIISIVVILLICVIVVFKALDNESGTENSQTSIVNPIKEFNSLDEMKNDVDFEIKLPTKLPEGYNDLYFTTISSEIAQVVYVKEDKKITYRMSKRNDEMDISGTYGPFANEYTEDEITFRSNTDENLINIILWSDDEYDYSLDIEEGTEKNLIILFKDSVK